MADVNKFVSSTRVKNGSKTVLNNGGKLSTSVNRDTTELDLYNKSVSGQLPKVETVNLAIRQVGQQVTPGDGAMFLVPTSLNGFTLFKATARFYTAIAENGLTTFTVQKRTASGDTTIGSVQITDNATQSSVSLSTTVSVGDAIIVYLDGLNSEPAPDGFSVLLEFRKQ